MTNLTIRPMAPAERSYCYSWPTHLMAAAGCIGHLRGNMGRNGWSIYTRWDDHQPDLKTPEFKNEFDAVITALRSDPACGGVLASRGKLAAYCCAHPESRMGADSQNYGFRADTEDYAYMLRLTPAQEEHNLHIYCYVRKRLNHHMENAKHGIRFITSGYQDLFRLADGDRVRIIKPNGKREDHTCRYIDETHMTCGWNGRLYHIHDFAEETEKAGNTVVPLRSSLPEKCYAVLPSGDEIITVKHGESGYFHTDKYGHDRAHAQSIVDEYNEQLGVTKAQAAAMLAGSMFGWACPGADPANYDDQGRPVKPRA